MLTTFPARQSLVNLPDRCPHLLKGLKDPVNPV